MGWTSILDGTNIAVKGPSRNVSESVFLGYGRKVLNCKKDRSLLQRLSGGLTDVQLKIEKASP